DLEPPEGANRSGAGNVKPADYRRSTAQHEGTAPHVLPIQAITRGSERDREERGRPSAFRSEHGRVAARFAGGPGTREKPGRSLSFCKRAACRCVPHLAAATASHARCSFEGDDQTRRAIPETAISRLTASANCRSLNCLKQAKPRVVPSSMTGR